MSKLTFTYDDFSRQGIEKYRVDLQRRLRATGVIEPRDTVSVDRRDFFMEVETHATELDMMCKKYVVIGDKYAVEGTKVEKPIQVAKKKRWWRR